MLNKGWTNYEWAKWVNYRKYYCNMIPVSSRSALSNCKCENKRAFEAPLTYKRHSQFYSSIWAIETFDLSQI